MSLEANQLQTHLKLDKNINEYRFDTVLSILRDLDKWDGKPSGGNWWRRTEKPSGNWWRRNERPSNNWWNRLNEHQIWMVWNAIDAFTIQQREESYLSNHEKLSEVEYNNLFSWKEQLHQWQFWDCYLVTAINQLANVQHFDTLMRTSISRVKRDEWQYKWKEGYMVQIPFWEPSARKIYIQDDELKIAKINWNTWYKILELAYAKNRRPNNAQWNRYYPITEAEFKKITWWWTHEVLQTFLGKQNISLNTFWDNTRKRSLSMINSRKKEEITWFLKNYNPNIWNRFVSLSSIWWESDTKQYTIGWNTLYHKHAYSLAWVKKDSRWEIKHITILNPWNTDRKPWWNYQDFTLNEFFQAFSYMSCWKIKTSEFLNEKSLG